MLIFDLEPKTEILATAGPTLHTVEQLEKAVEIGAYNYRLALSSRDRDVVEYVSNIREVEKKTGKQLDVILDFPATRPRTCDMNPIFMNKGDTFVFEAEESATIVDSIRLNNFVNVIQEIKKDDRMFFRDGKIQLLVLEKDEEKKSVKAVCTLASADLRANCSCVFPDTSIVYEPIMDLDRDALKYLKDHDLFPDWFVISFASDKKQIDKMKNLAKEYFPNRKVKMMAKIETENGITNINEIIKNVDGIMIGRGDLALHIDPVKVPKVQEFLVNYSRDKGKVCVIATEFLEVFANTGIINRAELSDIALGTRQKATSLMLSMESANSKFSMESIKLMKDVISDNN